ncbi:MAG: hypothetical protein M3O73_01450 [Actinomycetota bacterium]|nr:hypothetical protein [Actinomycetota bacterium]
MGVHVDQGSSLRDTLYVDELIGPETISTMPAETFRAFQDHGHVEVRLKSDLEEAQHLFNQLYAAGVDYEDVAATLEREEIDKFVASFIELLRGIAEKRQQLAVAVCAEHCATRKRPVSEFELVIIEARRARLLSPRAPFLDSGFGHVERR